MADAERTEPATSHKRQEARKKGQVAKSTELNTAFVLLVSFLALRAFGPYIFRSLKMIMELCLTRIGSIELTESSVFKYSLTGLLDMGLMLLPLIFCIALSAVVANFLQVGVLGSLQVLKPQLSRINPISGMKRIFSGRIAVELFKSCLKIGITAYVAFMLIKSQVDVFIDTMNMEPSQSMSLIWNMIYQVGVRISLALGAMGILDYVYQKWEYEKSLRMTKQEIKEEMIRYEGRPEVKQRIRTVQRQMAMKRMMQDVPKADVIITNPTHLAIAISYNPKEMAAPKVLAKGARLVAKKIVEIARQNGIPVVENKPLARALFKIVEVGQFIPLAFYQTVADVLAFVWRTGKLKRNWF